MVDYDQLAKEMESPAPPVESAAGDSSSGQEDEAKKEGETKKEGEAKE